MKTKRIEIIGVPIDCVDMAQAVEKVEVMIAGNRPQAIIAVNPEKVIKARGDSRLLGQLQRAGLLIPDGIGVVAAARFLRLGRMGRVPGSELMPAICARAAVQGYRIFLFGGSPEVNEKTVRVLCLRYPGLQVVGYQHGYLPEEEMPGLIDRINSSGAEILFVALGSPKQELWIDRYLSQLRVKVCQGVGGTFDILAGRVRRAPRSFRKLHLEWFYRLATQPKRLVRQSALPKFAYLVLRQKVVG
ncbi:MAG: WecB/TagA/CpsF family glycosyltransferase [Candidatus Manganitrophaceae bacterium]